MFYSWGRARGELFGVVLWFISFSVSVALLNGHVFLLVYNKRKRAQNRLNRIEDSTRKQELIYFGANERKDGYAA